MSIKIFGLNGTQDFAEKVCRYIDIEISSHIEKHFEDGEFYSRADQNVRGGDVYVIHSLYGDEEMSAGEKLANLAFFCGSLKDASAGRITVVCPYLPFARQDRKTESRAPIATKYVAQILEAMGVSRLLTMDIHNLAAFQNAFRIPTDNLEAKLLFVQYLEKQKDWKQPLVCLSPDSGGMHRTRRFRESLERKLGMLNQISIAYLDKERLVSSGAVNGDKIVGDVENKDVIIIDDMISTGSTIKKSKEAVEAHGGTVYAVISTHGLFIGDASGNLDGLHNIIISDTVPPFRLTGGDVSKNVHVVETAELFARAIRRNHDGASISELLED